MGFINEIRKMLFGMESVTKSQADKSAEYVKEKADHLEDSIERKADRASEFFNETGDALKDRAKETGKKAKMSAENIWSKLENEAEDLWREIADDEDRPMSEEQQLKMQRRKERLDNMKKKANQTWEKTIAVSDDINEELFERGEKFWEKTKKISERIGDKLLDKGEDVFEKGKNIFDELSEKAQREWEEERRKKGYQTPGSDMADKAKDAIDDVNIGDVNRQAHRMSADIAEEIEHIRNKKATDGSLLSGTDDFFERADRFARGDYHNTGDKDPAKEGETHIVDDVAKPAPKEGSVKGFKDHDGDGNEIIDDAILELDDDEPDQPV